MMIFVDYVEAIVAAVKAALPALKSCESHPGRFDIKEIQNFATQTPAVRVAFLGIESIDLVNGGERDVTTQMAMFVWTREAPGLPRDVSALNIINALAELVPENRWDIDCTFDPTGIRAQNLYSGEVAKKGLMVWALSWHQVLRIGEADMFGIDDEVAIIPDELYVAYEPDVGEGAAYTPLQGVPDVD